MSGCAVKDTQCEKEKKAHFISKRHERDSLIKQTTTAIPNPHKKGTQPFFRH
jgi:hypothetical protein